MTSTCVTFLGVSLISTLLFHVPVKCVVTLHIRALYNKTSVSKDIVCFGIICTVYSKLHITCWQLFSGFCHDCFSWHERPSYVGWHWELGWWGCYLSGISLSINCNAVNYWPKHYKHCISLLNGCHYSVLFSTLYTLVSSLKICMAAVSRLKHESDMTLQTVCNQVVFSINEFMVYFHGIFI